MAWNRPTIGGTQAGSGWNRPDIGGAQAAPAAPGGTTPKGPLHHPLWGALAGPIFCIITIVATVLKGLRQ